MQLLAVLLGALLCPAFALVPPHSGKISTHTDTVISVAYSPNGKHIASGGCTGDPYARHNRTFTIWDVATGRSLHTVTESEAKSSGYEIIFSAVYSPGGNHLAYSNGKTIKIWDAAVGKSLHNLTGHTDIVNAVAYSPDGNRLASGGADNTIKIWDAATGKSLHSIQGPLSCRREWGNTISSLAYSPDGKHLASGSCGGITTVWDVATGEALHTLAEHEKVFDVILALAYSPDGKHLASGSPELGNITIWDVATGRSVQTLGLRWVDTDTRKVAYSPDGKHLAASDGNYIKIWDVATGKKLYTLKATPEEYPPEVYTLTYSPDGKHLAAGCDDGVIRFWDVESLLTVKAHDLVV